jgi:hypothetical protein
MLLVCGAQARDWLEAAAERPLAATLTGIYPILTIMRLLLSCGLYRSSIAKHGDKCREISDCGMDQRVPRWLANSGIRATVSNREQP